MKNTKLKFDKRFIVNLSKASTAVMTTSALLSTPVLLTPDVKDYMQATVFMAMLCVWIPYAATGYRDWKYVGRKYVKLYDDTADNIGRILQRTKEK